MCMIIRLVLMRVASAAHAPQNLGNRNAESGHIHNGGFRNRLPGGMSGTLLAAMLARLVNMIIRRIIAHEGSKLSAASYTRVVSGVTAGSQPETGNIYVNGRFTRTQDLGTESTSPAKSVLGGAIPLLHHFRIAVHSHCAIALWPDCQQPTPKSTLLITM